MTSIDSLTAALPKADQPGPSGSYLDHSHLEHQSLKRRRTLPPIPFMSGGDLLSEGYDDCDRPLKKERTRRKSSLLNIFNREKKNDAGWEKMQKTNWNRHQHSATVELSTEQGAPSNGNAITAQEVQLTSPKPTQEQARRRSSTLSKITSLFRLRRDSKIGDASEPTSPVELDDKSIVDIKENPHALGELHHFQASMEPLAMDGYLRFQKRSVDDLQSFDGPSTYYKGESYQDRGCKLQRRSPFCDRLRGESPDWIPDNIGTPTPETNADAGLRDEPHRWSRLTGKSPVPRMKGANHHQVATLQLPGFLKNSFRRHKQSSRNGKAKAAEQLQTELEAPSINSRTFSFSNHPNIFGKDPDLSLRSLDELGVLPAIEVSSVESSSDIPHVVYTNEAKGTPTSSMIPLIANDENNHPASSSLEVDRLHNSANTSPPCLHSPSLTPVDVPTFNLPNFSLQSSSPNPFSQHPKESQPRPTTNLPSLLALAESADRSGATSPTADDNASSHEGLGLRRMSHLANILEDYNISGEGHLSFDYKRAEHDASVEHVDHADRHEASRHVNDLDHIDHIDHAETRDKESCLGNGECWSTRGRSLVRKGSH